MVISTGMVVPFISLVLSLNCVTNWPMFTPCWPSAGPTGGAGVAWPPGHWSFTYAVICFAMRLFQSSPRISAAFLGLEPGTTPRNAALILGLAFCLFRKIHLPVFQLDR